MGDGEYGGNGSVHYYAILRRDRNHGNGNPHSYHEVDDQPAVGEGGDFVVQVFGVPRAAGDYDQRTGTWTIRAAIRQSDEYTEQIRITWPPDPPRDLKTVPSV
jgi:hypothetical protein